MKPLETKKPETQKLSEKYRKYCYRWLKFTPECITLLDTVADHLSIPSREKLYKAVAEHDLWGSYPADDGDYDPFITALATDIILYAQYLNGQRDEKSTLQGFTSPIFYEILAIQQPDFLSNASWREFPPYSNNIKNIHLNRRTK